MTKRQSLTGDRGGDGVATDVSSRPRSRPDNSVETTRFISYRCRGLDG